MRVRGEAEVRLLQAVETQIAITKERGKKQSAFQEVLVSDFFRRQSCVRYRVPFWPMLSPAFPHPRAEARFLSSMAAPSSQRRSSSPYHDLGSLEHLSLGGRKFRL